MAGFQRFPYPDLMGQLRMFKEFKGKAKQSLSQNRLAEAHQWYNAALSFFEQPFLPQPIANEHHVILCNRSQVCYRQGLYQQSLEDAVTAISICPTYAKAYWRASQAVIAGPGNGQELALKFLADALLLGLNEQDQRHFLTEICKLAINTQLTGLMRSTLCSLHLPDARNKIWLSVIKKLCDQNEWEGMAMLLIHYEPRSVQHFLNILDVSEWKCGDIIVGKLLSTLPDAKMAIFGERLAICLLQKGASIETIEEYTMTNSLHFLVDLSLRIRSVTLLRFVLDNYECIRAKINYQDNEGNTALHLVVKANVDNVDICENVVVLLLKKKCDMSLRDCTNKIPADYVNKDSKLFQLLQQVSNPVEELRKKLEQLKSEGNKAFGIKDYTRAVHSYNEALVIAQQLPDLYKEAAILYSNKSNVRFQTGDIDNAQINALAAINADPEYYNGYFWNSKALFRLGSAIEAFKTLVDGYSKSKQTNNKVDLLTGAAVILNSFEGEELVQCYQMLDNQNPDIWQNVLTQLSKKSEWKSIAYLILGSNLETCTSDRLNSGEHIATFCTGVAGKCSTANMETKTVLNFLKGSDEIPSWLNVVMCVVHSHGGDQTLRGFAVVENDCPLHAVLRFVLKTGSTLLLEKFPQSGSGWCDKSGAEESGFHILAKNKLAADCLYKLARTLLMKGYNDVLRKDKNGKIPYDYLHDDYPCRVYDLFLPDNKTIEPVHARRLCNIGKLRNNNNKHETAINIFNKVLRLRIKKDHFTGHEDIHADALKNKAESYLKIGDLNKALKEADKSKEIVPSCDVFLICAKARAGLRSYDQAFGDYINAFDYSGAGKTSQVLEVCEEIVKFLSQLPNQRSKSMTQRISRTRPGNGPLWARICHNCVLHNEWKTGEIAHNLFKYDQEARFLPIQINVACFCSLNDIRSHPWSANMMLYFLHCGSDRTAISLEQGDTYLHASVRISLVASFPDLLTYVIKKTNANELHLCDRDGNTLLHIATKERKIDRHARCVVIKILLKCGIDAQKLNNDKRTACSYLSGEKKNRELIAESIQKQTTGNQKKRFNGNESRSHPNGTNAMQQDRKERRRKCDECEQQLAKALEIISTDKTGGLKAMTDILTSNHSNTFHTSIEKKVVDDLVKYLESPEDISTLLSPLRKEKYYMIMEGLFLVQKWAPLILTVKAFNKKFGDKDLKKFTSKFTVKPLIVAIEPVSDDEELENICFLLNNGWSIGDGNGKVTLKKAVDLKKYKLSVEIIKRGADVSELSLQEGDTPIHALIKVALEVKESKFIEDLLNKWNADKDKYPFLDPEQVDVNGDCIYHLLTKSGYSDIVLQITEILCDYNVSADFYNKEQKFPSEYVKKKHFRLLDYLKNASRIKASRKQVAFETFEKEDKNDSTTGAHEFDLEHKPKPKSRKEQIQESRKNIEYLLSLLPEYIEVSDVVGQNNAEIKRNESIVDDNPNHLHILIDEKVTVRNEQKREKVEKGEDMNVSNNNSTLLSHGSDYVCSAKCSSEKGDNMVEIIHTAEQNQTFEDCRGDNNIQKNDLKESDVKESDVSDSDSDELSEPPSLDSDEDDATDTPQSLTVLVHDDLEHDMDEQNTFENLPWEVECTDKVLKVLEDKQVIPELRHKILRIIKMLANGDWQRHLCKQLKNVPKSIMLFEAKLSKGRRIIWENAISFSSRCSETADNRLNPSKKGAAHCVRGGRIYSQLIRVWDVVMDHDKIERSVENIKRSHQRGNTCIIQRKLKGLKKENEQRLKTFDKTYPLLFTENEPEISQNLQELEQVQHIPPASSNETEYHILKFYPVDTPLVKHFLQNSDVKVDFPFKVTDLEHAVINLSGKEAILLLGRSGTGKTTCCLYRLWSQYKLYWINRRIEDPLLPGSSSTQCLQNDDCIDKNNGASADCIEVENENDQACGTQAFEHFHQVFITKNQVLAAEVKKTFKDFKNAEVCFSAVPTESSDQLLPNRLQDLQEKDYPLFLTSRQMLCKLDASIGDPFFKREEDGSMKIHVDGWEVADEGLTDLRFLDYDSDDEGGFDENESGDNEPDKKKREGDVHREVTYEVFENEMWRKLGSKTKTGYHPSLVWTEIMSFIKGSYESLSSKTGYLSKEEYMELGRKRAPNFTGQRDDIYDIFLLYEHYKKNHQMFDETDVVHDIFRRLANMETAPITIHQIYVDETQDFTQAELFLLIRLCKNPNDMFLTGDTAQSIMRGIAFRFEDLKTLFFHIKQNTKAKKSSKSSKSLEVHVPQLHQLTYNYRSHAGILKLASSILEVLVRFFPESFDRLEPDQGLFPGPEPILIESCTFSDLAVLLSGNRRETSNIEFGAHQVILVYNEEAKENLPEELSCGLVLTIYESKGLEFDDVLLFNFFKYSQASKEWRVVTKHLNELAETVYSRTSRTEQCVRIDNELLMSSGRPRPLDFDPNQHKILCSELKQLYTALTRARVNVWIYDEDPEKRAPMFEYFKALNLVKPVDITELNEESLSKVIFAENSSKQDWIKQGDSFMKNHLYNVAAQCFGKGGDRRKQMLAQAHDRALLASRRKDKLREKNEMRDEFLFAAELYLNCERYPEAAKCLSNAKEVKPAISLYTKLRQFEKAAELCKKTGLIVECSRLYESADKFNKAVSILYENGVYDIALDVLKRYKMRETEMMRNDCQSLESLRTNRPDKIYTKEKISLRAAEKYHEQNDFKRMQEAVSRFRDEDDKIEFYKKHQYINEAANLIASSGKVSEAVNLYMKHGMLDKARFIAEKSRDDIILAKTLLDISRITLATEHDNQALDTVKADLTKSLEIFNRYRETNLAGNVLLLHAKVYDDIKYILSAGEAFLDTRPCTNEAGYLECCNLLVQFTDQNDQNVLDFLLKGVNCLFKVCNIFLLKFSSTSKGDLADEKKFVTYCQFYGLFPKGDVNFEVLPATKPLCENMLSIKPTSSTHKVVSLDTERCSHMIVFQLLTESKPWVEDIKKALIHQRSTLQLCKSFKLGEECTGFTADVQTCIRMHKPYTMEMFQRLIKTDVQLAEYEVYLNKTNDILKLCESKYSKAIKIELSEMTYDTFMINGNDKHEACKYLLNDCLLDIGHPVILAEDSSYMLRSVTANKVALEHIKQHLLQCWNESISGDKKFKSKASHETEVFLLLEFAYHLFHFDSGRVKFSKKPKDLMLSFEQALDKELMADGNLKKIKQRERSSTLMLSEKTPEGIYIERPYLTCVAHRFTDAYEHLAKGMPFDAVMSFAKFQTLLSQRKPNERSIVSFYPEIHRYLFWLEFYSTMTFLIIAKLKSQIDPEYSTLLPSQYIAMLYFVESTFPTEALSLIHSIANWTTKSTQRSTELMLDRMKRFAFVISGHAQIVKIPQLIENACTEDKSNFILLERLLILNMTMLCNIRQGVPIQCKSSLVTSLNKAFSKGNKTERLRKIHDPAQQLESVTHIIECLEKLLECRKMDERVFVVKWKPELKAKLRVKPLDTKSLPPAFLEQDLDEFVVETQKSVDDVSYYVEQTEDEIQADLQEKEEFNKAFDKEQEMPSTKSVNFDLSNDETNLDHAVIHEYGCFMCGIVFEDYHMKRKTEKELAKLDENTDTFWSNESSSKVKSMLRQGSAIENATEIHDLVKEEHINTLKHRQNIEQLQAFKLRYKSKIIPVVTEAEDLLKEGSSRGQEHQSETYKKELKGIGSSHERIKCELNDIKTFAQGWQEKQEQVIQLGDKLLSDIESLKSYKEQRIKETESQNGQGAVGPETSDANDYDEEGDIEEVVQEPVQLTERIKTKRQRKNERRKSRKK